ncbi:MAG: translocation/assembly module TamB [Bacteroidales bacterium]|nr:translocation/assembly module TamB [Bacteroidales bacterium]
MKKGWKIAGRVFVGLLLTVYVAVAAVNYSVVQSYLGATAGHYFSREWGGEVKIGSLHAMPWDHLMLNNVLLVAPDNDTILDVKRLNIRFKRFPMKDRTLSLDRVLLRNGYYHLAIREAEGYERPVTNLQYIIDYYTHGKRPERHGDTFTVDVKSVTLSHVHYKMDLLEIPGPTYDYGVAIAHMEFNDIRARAKGVHVVNDDVTVKLLSLSTTERSGFRADKIAADVHVGPHDITVTDFEARTPQSTVLADVSITYDGWEEIQDYVNTVDHDITIKEGTTVALSDVAYWVPAIWGTDVQLEAEGGMKGTVNEMTTDLSMGWGSQSRLLLAGRLLDVTVPDSMKVDVDIERLRTNADDMRPLLAMLNIKEENYPLIRQTDHIDLEGRLRGGLYETSTANLNIVSGLGNLHADALLHPTPGGGMQMNAEVGSDGLELGFLHSDWLNRTGFNLSMSGDLRNPKDIHTMRANLDGELLNSVIQGQRLGPIYVEGKMDGGVGRVNLQSTDSLALLTLQSEFDLLDTVKSLRGILDIENLNTLAFKLMPKEYGFLRTRAELTIEGRNLDTMQGNLQLTGTQLGRVKLANLSLSADANEGYKELQLTSDAADVGVTGKFHYEDLPLILRQMGRDIIPQGMVDITALDEEELAAIRQSQLSFHAQWKDDGRFLHSLTDKVTVARRTRLTGNYNSTEQLKFALRSDSLRFGSMLCTDVGLQGQRQATDYVVRLESQSMEIGTVELLQRADLQLNSNARRALLELAWGGDEAPSQGDVELELRDGNVHVLKPGFTIGDTPWELLIDNMTIATLDGFQMEGEGITVRSDKQSVEARLQIAQQNSDFVEMTFNRFNVKGITDVLLQDSPVALSGDIDGRFSLFGLNDIPYFNANMMIDSCVVNRQPLGDVGLRSNWNAELNILNLNVAGDQLVADGWMELGKPDADINFNVDFDSFELGLVAPLLSDFSSRFEGRLHGNFDITGSLSRPIIVGEALVEDGALQVDMTGVTYYFNDSIQFTHKKVTLDRFRIRDPRDNVAYVDGEISYEDLNDVQLDLMMNTDNLLVLDRHQGEEINGTVLASAEGIVVGPVDALQVYIDARTMPGCELTVPVNDQRQVKSQNYIHFVSDQPDVASQQTQQRKDQKLELELDLAITPDMQLNLPMDFSEITVKVGATGTGDLHLTMAGSDEPQVLGNYEITSGTMKFSAISIISKDFTIETGSNLNFQGSLPDARFDLKAVYSQRVNLSTLTGGQTDVSGKQKYIQVDDIIAIAGTLQEPTINFDLRLPNVDASVEEEVFDYIDRSSERDMLNQTLSLLAFGHFYNANSTSVNSNIATSGSISALNSILSDMTGVDIGVDYKVGNELTKDQVDVNISKDWGRLYLESTLGYGGESRELETGDVNSAIIDALVGYRLSPLVHLYAYNRTNTNDYTRMDLPYKQGVGLKLTKDFDRWSDLFNGKAKHNSGTKAKRQ